MKPIILLLSSSLLFANVCDNTDYRSFYFDSKIGRISINNLHKGCTVAMISKKCGISAGHCFKGTFAEFNIRNESLNGRGAPTDLSDRYEFKTKTYKKGKIGYDWMVIEFKKNLQTNKYPGEVNGFYSISNEKVYDGMKVRLSGYGVDYEKNNYSYLLRSSIGKIKEVSDMFNATFFHRLDSTGGDSGAPIISAKSNQIVGIHVGGGCSSVGGHNTGLYIKEQKDFMAAIRNCQLED